MSPDTPHGRSGNQPQIIDEARRKFQAVPMSGYPADAMTIPACAQGDPAIGHGRPLSTGIVQIRWVAPMLSTIKAISRTCTIK
jgi:hypothetical protein